MLDFNQQAVVDYRGHCLCIAGPGSGKTRTIIAKVGSLWKEKSGGICIVTFTRAATEEIKERIRLEHGAEVAKGVAVGTLAIGDAGAANAGLLAAQILATNSQELMTKIDAFRQAQTDMVLSQPDPSQVAL